jgi:2-dehydro-3-deoxygluconokinase
MGKKEATMSIDRYEVVTLGEPLAVIAPTEPGPLAQATTLTLGVGGAEANLAILLSRLGHRVQFISRVGADAFGQRIRQTLKREGVNTDGLLTDEAAPTGVYFREWLPDGARRVWYYRSGSAASHLAPDDLRSDLCTGIRLLHVSGITPALSSGCAATLARAIELAHAAGALVSFDPNYRPALWDTATAQQALLPLMASVDLLLMSHEDSRALLGVDDVEAVLRTSSALGAKIVVLKQAERGACAWDGVEQIAAPPAPAAQAIDPVGAGDAFNAGFLSAWLRGKPLAEALHLGARLGAATVATTGDYLPQGLADL